MKSTQMAKTTLPKLAKALKNKAIEHGTKYVKKHGAAIFKKGITSLAGQIPFGTIADGKSLGEAIPYGVGASKIKLSPSKEFLNKPPSKKEIRDFKKAIKERKSGKKNKVKPAPIKEGGVSTASSKSHISTTPSAKGMRVSSLGSVKFSKGADSKASNIAQRGSQTSKK